MFPGVFYALLAGFLGAVASSSAKLSLGADYLKGVCETGLRTWGEQRRFRQEDETTACDRVSQSWLKYDRSQDVWGGRGGDGPSSASLTPSSASAPHTQLLCPSVSSCWRTLQLVIFSHTHTLIYPYRDRVLTSIHFCSRLTLTLLPIPNPSSVHTLVLNVTPNPKMSFHLIKICLWSSTGLLAYTRKSQINQVHTDTDWPLQWVRWPSTVRTIYKQKSVSSWPPVWGSFRAAGCYRASLRLSKRNVCIHEVSIVKPIWNLSLICFMDVSVWNLSGWKHWGLLWCKS